MVYVKKKGDPELEAFKRFMRSKTYKKLSHLSKKLKNNPQFQKKLEELNKKYPLPTTEENYLEYIDRVEKEARAKGEKIIVFFKEWHDFCDQWGIDYLSLKMGGVRVKSPIRVGTRNEHGKDLPFIEGVAPHTGQEYRDYEPLYRLITNHKLGKAQVIRGRSSNLSRDKKIKKEFKSRRNKGEKTEELVTDLTNKYGLSADRIYRIAYSRKND